MHLPIPINSCTRGAQCPQRIHCLAGLKFLYKSNDDIKHDHSSEDTPFYPRLDAETHARSHDQNLKKGSQLPVSHKCRCGVCVCNRTNVIAFAICLIRISSGSVDDPVPISFGPYRPIRACASDADRPSLGFASSSVATSSQVSACAGRVKGLLPHPGTLAEASPFAISLDMMLEKKHLEKHLAECQISER